MGTVVLGFNVDKGTSVSYYDVTYNRSTTSSPYYYTSTTLVTTLIVGISVANLVSVDISYGVTSIGYNAFRSCSNLTSVTIPNSVTSIGENAFIECFNLESVTFLQTSNTLTNIESGVFDDTALATAYMYRANTSAETYITQNYSSSVTIVYLADAQEVVVGFSSSQSYLTFNGTIYTYDSDSDDIYYYRGSSVTAVGGFSNYPDLVYVNIGDGVTSIGESAFQYCSNLASITIPNSVTSIGNDAFTACSTLALVTIGTSVKTIGVGAFLSCSALASVTIPDSVETIDSSAFRACFVLTSVTIGTGVTSIGEFAFTSCSKLASVTFLQTSNTLTNIERGVFYYTALATAYMYRANTNAKNYMTSNYSDVTISYLDATCFLEGSKILTDKGYVKIEELCKGDNVKTALDGYKKIDMIGCREMHHVGIEERIKDQLYKCSKENYPEILEDLIMTGCHSILVDNFKNEKEREKMLEIMGKTYITGNKYRLPICADDRAVVYEKKGDYKVYHVALENDDYYKNYGIFANGLLVESCSKRYLKELSGMELL
jgi:hypothetical protein